MNPDRQGGASLSAVCRRISPLFRLGSAKTPNRGFKGSRKNNFTEWALGFGSDLADPIEQNRRHSRLCRGFVSEVSGKDGPKPRWQNVKLFLRES